MLLDLPSLSESDNEEPLTYAPTPLKFSTSSLGYAPPSLQFHPSSYNYAPPSPRYNPSSPTEAPTSPEFNRFGLGYAPSPLQPNTVGHQVMVGWDPKAPTRPDSPFATGSFGAIVNPGNRLVKATRQSGSSSSSRVEAEVGATWTVSQKEGVLRKSRQLYQEEGAQDALLCMSRQRYQLYLEHNEGEGNEALQTIPRAPWEGRELGPGPARDSCLWSTPRSSSSRSFRRGSTGGGGSG